MKKLSFLTGMFLLPLAIFAQTVSFTVKGSDTCLPLLQKLAEVYMKQHKNTSVTVVGGGSGVGISALMGGTTDIAMSSRKMKMDEKLKMQEAKRPFREVIIANDALSVIVHPQNKINQLTREQIEAIFTGKVKNWKEIGGDDLPIVAYSRESSSGTFEFFKDHVLQRKNFAPNVLLMPATGAIVQSVKQTMGAIGYVGLAYLEKGVKPLKVSYDQGKTFVEPEWHNAINKTYPISRPLYLYYTTDLEARVKPFIDFILSAEGQKIVREVGYVPLR